MVVALNHCTVSAADSSTTAEETPSSGVVSGNNAPEEPDAITDDAGADTTANSSSPAPAPAPAASNAVNDGKESEVCPKKQLLALREVVAAADDVIVKIDQVCQLAWNIISSPFPSYLIWKTFHMAYEDA